MGMPQAGVAIAAALLSFNPFFCFCFFFFPFNPWKQSQRAAAPGSASRWDLGFAGDSRKIPWPKRALGLPGGFWAGQGIGRSGDIWESRRGAHPGLQKENCPTAEIGSEPQNYNKQLPGQGPWLFSLCFGSERKIYFVCCLEFFFPCLFFFPLPLEVFKAKNPPEARLGLLLSWMFLGPWRCQCHQLPCRTSWDVFKAHPFQTCRAFVASR